jgi:hypothetical protein
MTAEFVVKRTGGASDAVVYGEGITLATLHGDGALQFKLSSQAGGNWSLDPRVNGEIRPFSMNVTFTGGSGKPVLTIMNHIFFHNAKAYMLTGVPQDIHPAEHILGKRHVNRLDRFPFSSLEEIDRETWGRMGRQRGVSVGTMEGLGLNGFKVELNPELQDIGLPLSAAAYLLYSTA